MAFAELRKRIEQLLGGAFTPAREPASWGFTAAVAGFLLAWFWVGSVMVVETNQNRLRSDQQYNIELAKDAESDWYPHRVKGIVEPLWPWLASKFNAESDAETFVRGKQVNLLLGGGFLAIAAFWLRRRWGALPSLVFMSVGGLGGLLERCVYFQPEPLYYIFSLGAFACMLELFHRNPLWLFAVCGVLCGFAHLSKSAVPPMMAGFAGVSLALVAGSWLSRRFRILATAADWSAGRQLVGLLVLCTCFGLVLAPRAVFSQRQFGDPFHSWPSYWMWQDDFGSESIPFMAAHPDRASLESLPPELKPSPGNYLATHTLEEVLQRLRTGMSARMHEFFFHEGKVQSRPAEKGWKSALRYRGCFLVAVLAVCTTLAVAAVRSNRFPARVFWPDLCSLVFVAGIFFAYWAAFGWYYAIGRGTRFMLALYMPMLYAALAASTSLASRMPPNSKMRKVAAGGLALILALAGLRTIELVIHPHFIP